MTDRIFMRDRGGGENCWVWLLEVNGKERALAT